MSSASRLPPKALPPSSTSANSSALRAFSAPQAREVDHARVDLAEDRLRQAAERILRGDPNLLDNCLPPHVPEPGVVALGPDHLLERAPLRR
jgi:hypothetical protein